MNTLYEVIFNPFVAGAVQLIIILFATTEVVGATGVEGTVAHKIVIMLLGLLYPNEFLD